MMAAQQGTNNAYTVFRVLQVLALLPAWAMMAALVAAYSNNSVPSGIMALFIVTLLAWVWAFCILILWLRARNTALWIAFWDVVAMGILITGVAMAANLVTEQCSDVNQDFFIISPDGTQTLQTQNPNDPNDPLTGGSNGGTNRCALLQGAWALAIANIVFFFVTAILSLVIWRENRYLFEEPVIREKIIVDPEIPRRARHHHSRRHHRSRQPSGRVRTERVYVR